MPIQLSHEHIHNLIFIPMDDVFAHKSFTFLDNLPLFPPHSSIYKQHYHSQLVSIAILNTQNLHLLLCVHIFCASCLWNVEWLETEELHHLHYSSTVVTFGMAGKKMNCILEASSNKIHPVIDTVKCLHNASTDSRTIQTSISDLHSILVTPTARQNQS